MRINIDMAFIMYWELYLQSPDLPYWYLGDD